MLFIVFHEPGIDVPPGGVPHNYKKYEQFGVMVAARSRGNEDGANLT
jgi:hypothetical protein